MGNPWLAHVKMEMKKNPRKPFKEVLKLAKKTYKKKPSANKSVVKKSVNLRENL